MHRAETCQQEQQPHHDHAGRIGQVLDAGDSLEWKLKQKTGHDAEIDIIASVIIGMVPQAVDLGRFAGGGIVGVIQRQQLFRRVLHQVQAAVQQTVGQRAVLLVDKADLASRGPRRRHYNFQWQGRCCPGSQKGTTTTKAARIAASTAPAARSQTLPASQRRCHRPLCGRRA